MMGDTIIDVYNIIAKQYYEIREQMALKPEIERLCSLLTTGNKILDVGCGNGRDLVIFEEKGFNITGIDFSDGQLTFARQRIKGRKIRLEKQDIFNLNFNRNSFDGIWCCAVLSHYRKEQVIDVMKSFHFILKKNGYAIIVIKKGQGETYVCEKEFGGIKRFTTFFSEEDIYKFAKESQFSVIDVYSYNEQMRFSEHNRDLDFIVAILKNN